MGYSVGLGHSFPTFTPPQICPKSINCCYEKKKKKIKCENTSPPPSSWVFPQSFSVYTAPYPVDRPFHVWPVLHRWPVSAINNAGRTFLAHLDHFCRANSYKWNLSIAQGHPDLNSDQHCPATSQKSCSKLYPPLKVCETGLLLHTHDFHTVSITLY